MFSLTWLVLGGVLQRFLMRRQPFREQGRLAHGKDEDGQPCNESWKHGKDEDCPPWKTSTVSRVRNGRITVRTTTVSRVSDGQISSSRGRWPVDGRTKPFGVEHALVGTWGKLEHMSSVQSPLKRTAILLPNKLVRYFRTWFDCRWAGIARCSWS